MPTNPVLLHLLLPTNQAVARGVGEFLPELQVGGSYESLDLRVACGKLLYWISPRKHVLLEEMPPWTG